MRSTIAVLACVGLGAISLAAADPAATQSSATAATPAAPPAASAPAAAPAAASAAQPAAEAKPAAEDLREKHFLAEGYKLEMRNGERVFCRREEQMGTRLGAQKVCSTAEQLTLTEQQAKASVNRTSMQQNNPTGH